MKIVLLAGYRNHPESECPWLVDSEGLPLLERRIRQAREISPSVVVVLSGLSSDDALRNCPSLEKCELVFDTNGSRANLLSNLRSALKLGVDPAIVLPIEISFGPHENLKQLVFFAVQQGLRAPFHLIQAVASTGEIYNGGFPLIISANGGQELLANDTLLGLSDPQIRLHELHLASRDNPL